MRVLVSSSSVIRLWFRVLPIGSATSPRVSPGTPAAVSRFRTVDTTCSARLAVQRCAGSSSASVWAALSPYR